MTQQQPLPPAGWYPDPSGNGQQRYFDGAQWTEHRASGTGVVATSKPPTGKVIAAIIGAFVLLAIVGNVVGSHDSSSSSSSTSRSSSTASSRFVAAPPTTSATPTGPVRPEGVAFRVDQGTNGDVVFAQFKIADALFMGLTKSLARQTTIQILEWASTEYPTAQQIYVQGTFPTKDAYGNSNPNTIVLNVGYERSTLDKINFDGVDSDNIWELRDSGTVHPDLQG